MSNVILTIMQLKTLGVQGSTSVKAITAVIKSMSLEEAAATVATTGLTEAEKIRLLVNKGLCSTDEEAIEALAMHSAGNVATAGTTDLLSAASLKLKAALKGVWAVIKANPFLIAVTATAAAIGIVIAAYKKANPSTETLAKNLDKSKQKIQESTQKITEMESELEKVQSRMSELESMGSLSVVDKKELEQLEAYNAQLEKSKELEKAQRRIQNQESVDKFIDWFENDMYDVGEYYYSLNDNLEKPSDAVNTREHPIAAFGYRMGANPLQTSEEHFINAMFDSFDKQIEERANATTTEAKDKADMLILMTFNKLII